ncbi:cytochrome P450 [Actinokineospora globicatena]|uniref:cytochrome P450 n=1 Tax=Actinokineospora globicatena TaxID=103729 RepID=UPI0020A2B359|nr:cytochrome P450 [Actinokineospora globicatena]MCP2306487.1 Cytochrome P450 [Actinokineospora globicatena]GLW81916.1 cytochrome P450 [Actinokineospora globicatena]GLW88710.1 cytochrome P450 [Actinokineospora globicatena]
MATPTTTPESTATSAESTSTPAIPTQGKPTDEPRSFRLLGLPLELTERAAGCPFAPATRLTELSTTGPVHRVDGVNGDDLWVVTGHAEARAVLSDPRFSSDLTRSTVAMSRLPEQIRDQLLSPRNRAGNFLGMDAPQHTRYRKLLTGQFTVRRMRQLEPRIAEIVTEHLDALIAAGPTADLVSAFALPVPSLVISELLGVDYADRGTFQQRTAKLLNLDTPLDEVVEQSEALREFMRALIRAKRAEPTDDLLSGLVHADPDNPLTDDELVGMANLLLIAGHETTANMLALGTFALLEHPDQLALLRDDPALTATAVEELLRFLTILHLGIRRTPLEEVELAGHRIPPGANVLISAQMANLDEEQYEDPTTLDLTRPRASHLAFGHGIHQCLGQQLARVEMTTAFTELLRRLPGLRLAVPADQVPLRENMAIYGVHELPVTWDAARA